MSKQIYLTEGDRDLVYRTLGRVIDGIEVDLNNYTSLQFSVLCETWTRDELIRVRGYFAPKEPIS